MRCGVCTLVLFIVTSRRVLLPVFVTLQYSGVRLPISSPSGFASTLVRSEFVTMFLSSHIHSEHRLCIFCAFRSTSVAVFLVLTPIRDVLRVSGRLFSAGPTGAVPSPAYRKLLFAFLCVAGDRLTPTVCPQKPTTSDRIN